MVGVSLIARTHIHKLAGRVIRDVVIEVCIFDNDLAPRTMSCVELLDYFLVQRSHTCYLPYLG